MAKQTWKARKHNQYEWGAEKTKKSSFNQAGQELAFPSCIYLSWSLAIGVMMLRF